MIHITSKTLIAFLFIVAALGCKSETGDVAEKYPEGIVAEVGSFKISDQHFKNELIRFYNRTGQSVNLNPDVRNSILNSRIDRYAMVEFAKAEDWHLTPEAEFEKIMIERKVNMEEFKRRFIYDEVNVSENDLRVLFYRLNTSLKASHLFAKNKSAADSLHHLLMQGSTFEELAQTVFENPSLANNGGDLGYFTVDDMDIAFEDNAYRMEVGEISEPIKTSRGYSIIKLTDIVETPVITESQFTNRKEEMTPLALDQKKELALRFHIRQTTDSFQLNKDLFDEIWRSVKSDRNSYIQSHINDKENLLPSLSENLLDSVLLSNPYFSFTVSDFLQEAFYTSAEKRFEANEEWMFKEQLLGMAYRRYALYQVMRHHEYESLYVERAIEETFFNYLIEKFNEYAENRVVVSQAEILNEFEENSKLYQNPLELNLAEIVLTRKDEAEEAWKRLQQGEAFEEILELYTIDRQAVDRGGELGFIPIDKFGMMSPSLGKIEPGEYSGPYQITSNRFVIFKCIDRKEPSPVIFSEARPQVEEFLTNKKSNVLKRELIEESKERFGTKIYTENLNNLTIEL